MAIQSVTLTASPANVYISSGNSAVTAMYLHNIHSAAVQFSVHAIASGNIATSGNRIYGNVLLQSGDTYVIDTEKLILSNGDMIQANASTTSTIVATISYIGI